MSIAAIAAAMSRDLIHWESQSATRADSADIDAAQLGVVATWVRDRQIPLEACPTSNIQTGTAPSIAEHPLGLLRRHLERVVSGGRAVHALADTQERRLRRARSPPARSGWPRPWPARAVWTKPG